MIDLTRDYYSIFRIMKEVEFNSWQNIIVNKGKEEVYAGGINYYRRNSEEFKEF